MARPHHHSSSASPYVDIRVEFKPLLSSSNIVLEFSKDLVTEPSRVTVESNAVCVETVSFQAEFTLSQLQLKPNTCRGLRWIGPRELMLTLEAEWNPAMNGVGESSSPQLESLRQHLNQEHLVSKISACQSKCFCVGCGAQIFKPSCVFKRVLPLPSENWSDFADIWFCHNHGGEGHNHCHTPAEPVHSEQRDLRPRADDCLVGGLYLLINAGQAWQCALSVVGDKLICRRCGNFLGFVKRENSSIPACCPNETDVYKIYLHAICFRSEKNKELIPKPLIPTSLADGKETSLLREQSIESFLCQLLRDQSHKFTSFRFLVDANQQMKGQSDVTILLWLLDQDLVIFSSSSKRKSQSSQKSSSNLNSPSESSPSTPKLSQELPHKIRPHSCSSHKSMKLLYKADFLTVNGCVDSHLPDVFKAWSKDNTVHGITLPYPLCKQFLSLLITSTQRLPRSQRSLNSFHIGYLSCS